MQIINNNAGSDDSALNLQVQDGEAPMRTSSDTRVNNLNADKVDGLGAEEIGVNGLEIVSTGSDFNSDSPKSVRAECPEGKMLTGSGYSAGGTISGTFGNQTTDISVTDAFPVSTEDREDVVVVAYEEEPTADNWSVTAKAVCATEGTP